MGGEAYIGQPDFAFICLCHSGASRTLNQLRQRRRGSLSILVRFDELDQIALLGQVREFNNPDAGRYTLKGARYSLRVTGTDIEVEL